MITDKLKKLLEGQFVGLATVDDNSHPNLVAVEVNKIIDNNKILITDNFFNKTKTNILEDSFVSVSFWSKEPFAGFQFKGTAQYFAEGSYSDLVKQLNPGLPAKGYIIITVTEIVDLALPVISYKSNDST